MLRNASIWFVSLTRPVPPVAKSKSWCVTAASGQWRFASDRTTAQVFKYCLGACIPRSSCSSLRDAVVADSTVASMRDGQPVTVRVPVHELRVHKTEVVVDGRAVELAVAMGCSVRDAASQFCVTHRCACTA